MTLADQQFKDAIAISPAFSPTPVTTKDGQFWESLGGLRYYSTEVGSWRAKVPGGWLVSTICSGRAVQPNMQFVADPFHTWTVQMMEQK